MQQPTAAVALADSHASHCFVSKQLLANFNHRHWIQKKPWQPTAIEKKIVGQGHPQATWGAPESLEKQLPEHQPRNTLESRRHIVVCIQLQTMQFALTWLRACSIQVLPTLACSLQKRKPYQGHDPHVVHIEQGRQATPQAIVKTTNCLQNSASTCTLADL